MITLFPDQDVAVDALRTSYRAGLRSLLFVAPCGFGKTILFSYVAAGAARLDRRVLLLAHRDELVDQISDALTEQNVRHGIMAGGWRYERGRSVYVASVFTMARRLDSFTPDLIVIDEAHHCTPTTTWGRVLAAYPQAHRLGVTATPCRLSGAGLADCFDKMILGPTTQQLIEAGRLSPLRVFAPPTINTDNIRKRMGEFVQGDLIGAVDRPSITGSAVEHYKKHADGKRAVVFCISVEHTKHVAEEFRRAGYAAESIDGKLPRDVRRSIVAGFRRGHPAILTSCSLVDEGFDCPAIEVGIDLCPTESLSRFRQRAGRVLRTAPGKNEAILLDHAGNTLRHGLPTQDPTWTLEAAPKKSTSTGAVGSVRICPSCFSAQATRGPRCRNCGKEFPVDSRQVAQKKGELEELTPEQLMKQMERMQVGMTKGRDALINLATQRGYKAPERWADYVLAGREKKQRRA